MIPYYGTHSSMQRINKKSQFEWDIRSGFGAKKGKQVASSTKLGLEENVVLRLMEYLPSLLVIIYLPLFYG